MIRILVLVGKRMILRLLVTVLAAHFGLRLAAPPACRAQHGEDDKVFHLSSEMSELPDLISGDGPARLIGSYNSENFKAIIIPEMYRLLREGLIEISAARQIDLGRAGEQIESGRVGEAKIETLLEDGDVLSAARKFGSHLNILEDNDFERRGWRALWNVSSLFWGIDSVTADFILTGGADSIPFSGRLERVHRSGLKGVGGKQQIFREKISFISPNPLRGLTWMTFRFVDDREDVVWLHSPVISKTRRLVGSNRSDALLNTPLSCDDLFAWSVKPQMVRAVFDDRLEVLVPFAALSPVRAEDVGSGCWSVRTPESGFSAVGTTPALPAGVGGGGGPISSVLAVPRTVWRIMVESLDPFSSIGRTVVYIDAEAMLPILSIVYDRAGNHWKSLISVWGAAGVKNGEEVVPFPAMSLIEDRIQGKWYILRYKTTTFCWGSGALDPAAFDPGKLGQVGAPAGGSLEPEKDSR